MQNIAEVVPAIRRSGGQDLSVPLGAPTFTRNSEATYVSGEQVLTTAAINELRNKHFALDPVSGLLIPTTLLEMQRTNQIRNPRAEGAVVGVVGVDGALPTHWETSLPTGLARDVVAVGTENGHAFVDIRIYGTSTVPSGLASIRTESLTQVVAASGQTWTNYAHIRRVAGSMANISAARINIYERQSGGTFIKAHVGAVFDPDSTADLINARRRITATLDGGESTARIQPIIELPVAENQPVDITLRIGGPQLELGAFASNLALPVVGTPAATTRSADNFSYALPDTLRSSVFPQFGGMFVLARFIEGGTILVTGTAARVVQISTTGAGHAWLSVDSTTMGFYRAQHVNGGGGSVSSTLNVTPALGNRVTLLLVLAPSGSVRMRQQVNSGAVVSAPASGAHAPSEWTTMTAWVNSVDTAGVGRNKFFGNKRSELVTMGIMPPSVLDASPEHQMAFALAQAGFSA